MHWYVLYTKPNRELKVLESLNKQNIEAYCPVKTEIHQWSDRKKKIVKPLFKSFVFVYLKEKERPIVFNIPGVINYLFWLGKPAMVRDEEIEIIKEWLRGDSKEINVEVFTVGDKVKIKEGPLKDKSAIVEKIGKKRIRLILPSIGYCVTTNSSNVR